MSEAHLKTARRAKNDAFHTKLADVENELRHHAGAFRGAHVYCPCDHAEQSAFVGYFLRNFDALGLRRITATGYNPHGRGTWFARERGHGAMLPACLDGNGDFRSMECRGILESADIVVTNPPFSLMRDFLGWLVDSGKHFVFLGTLLTATTRYGRAAYLAGKMRPGAGCNAKLRFSVHDSHPAKTVRRNESGGLEAKINNVTWWTSLPVARRAGVELTGRAADFQCFDQCPALNIPRLVDIPRDWFGVMGVPITYLCQHDPAQFRLVNITSEHEGEKLTVAGKYIFKRVFIQRNFFQENTCKHPAR